MHTRITDTPLPRAEALRILPNGDILRTTLFFRRDALNELAANVDSITSVDIRFTDCFLFCPI